ncbi:acyltransferase [Inconstantimicrobium mannanitabidum]|uniref:Uncharacterized protein n=1 Tax=Inconstantimicrobium mannanitabidum TaxID=1604901 RepID=A0ACB5RE55_9CLOT|nr:acyltransferase [Clostridium sp. TW13]GKX67452.1 hypothetical protein rsdtw13_27100 [Clostridium sp. TW13]
MKISNYIEKILSLPKTLIFNFKYFPLKTALKLPILVNYNVCLKEISGEVILDTDIRRGIVKIGFGDIGIFDKNKSRSIWQVAGKVIFKGKSNIGHGSRISVNKDGELILGSNFQISAESSIICNKSITFGDNCLMSWDCLIMDTDFHKIFNINNQRLNNDKPIIIGSNVWIGCRNTILKGAVIGDNVIVAANSSICGYMKGENQIIGGSPMRVLKSDVYWEM